MSNIGNSYFNFSDFSDLTFEPNLTNSFKLPEFKPAEIKLPELSSNLFNSQNFVLPNLTNTYTADIRQYNFDTSSLSSQLASNFTLTDRVTNFSGNDFNGAFFNNAALPSTANLSTLSLDSFAPLMVPEQSQSADRPGGQGVLVASQGLNGLLAQDGQNGQIAQNTQPSSIPAPDTAPGLPAFEADGLGGIILEAIFNSPVGTSAILATRVNVAPPELLSALPTEVRQLIPEGASASMAFILPNNALDLYNRGGVSEVLMNSTLWLAVVPPSGAAFPAPAGSPNAGKWGTNAAYVMTIKMNGNPLVNSPTIDFRGGWGFFNDVRPQNILRGQSPIVSDRTSPDTWLFLNAGVTADLSRLDQIPSTMNNGLQQLSDSTTITPDGSLDFRVRGGGVVTAGALWRIPGSETVARRGGDAIVNFGQWVSRLPTPATTVAGNLISAAGVVLRQSSGVYFGPGGSISRLTVDTKGEVVFGAGNNSFNANLADSFAAGANIGAGMLQPFNEGAADSLRNSVQPTRTTIADIINTPTNTVNGDPQSNDLRLGLYWDGVISRGGTDLTNVGYGLVSVYNDPNVTPTQRENISNLYYREEMTPVRMMFTTMFDGPGDKLSMPTTLGTDNRFTSRDIPAAFNELKRTLPAGEYDRRVSSLAEQLAREGMPVNFGVRDLARELDAINRRTDGGIRIDPSMEDIRRNLRSDEGQLPVAGNPVDTQTTTAGIQVQAGTP